MKRLLIVPLALILSACSPEPHFQFDFRSPPLSDGPQDQKPSVIPRPPAPDLPPPPYTGSQQPPVDVPGPLGLFGVGGMWLWARKLRKRIKEGIKT